MYAGALYARVPCNNGSHPVPDRHWICLETGGVAVPSGNLCSRWGGAYGVWGMGVYYVYGCMCACVYGGMGVNGCMVHRRMSIWVHGHMGARVQVEVPLCRRVECCGSKFDHRQWRDAGLRRRCCGD